MAHRGQSRALLLRRRGRVQSYTPSAYSSQNTTLSHAASTDRKQTVICQLTNRNLCDMFYALRNTLWQTYISLSQNSGHYQSFFQCQFFNAFSAAEKGLLPKNPRYADSGDGWAFSIIVCFVWSISGAFFLAKPPQSMKTIPLFFLLNAEMTPSVNFSQPNAA